MSGEIIDDNFLNMNDDFDQYVKYLRLLFTDYNEMVESFDDIVEKNIFNKQTYVELTGIIKYASKRVFPLLTAFFGQDENFEDDVYREFMDIQLMVLYLFDKLQYEMDEIILKWDLNDAVIYDELINLESVNYLLKLIVPQLLLFVKIFDLKIQLIEGTISETEFQMKLVQVHDDMFI